MIPASVSLSCRRAEQKRLNESTFCLGWRLPRTQETLHYLSPNSLSSTARANGFDAAFATLVWLLIHLCTIRRRRSASPYVLRIRVFALCTDSQHFRNSKKFLALNSFLTRLGGVFCALTQSWMYA